ncbi:MAG: hypothetical protein KDA84_28885, partial [Planctomycetaceae bacterium]|nr:hypothetical protein [Planctomycetaceae bacterium]
MKRVYWRPRAVSQAVVVLVAVLALCSVLAIEFFKVDVQQPYYEEKVQAVKLSQNCMETIKARREELAEEEPLYKLDDDIDPAKTGMIGKMITEV